MKMRIFNLIFKFVVIILIFESFYLLAIPVLLDNFLDEKFISNIISDNTNISFYAEKIKFKTNLKPSLTISAAKIKTKNKLTGEHIASANNISFEISLIPLLFKTLEPKHFYSDNLQLSIAKGENGVFNFENLILSKNNNNFKLRLNDFDIKTLGFINKSNFEINVKYFSNNNFEGSAFLSNVNLKELFPFVQKFVPETKNIDGKIDFIQIWAEKNYENFTQIVFNTKFYDIVYNQNDWKNFINAKGKNTISSSIDIFRDKLKIKYFKYNADNIDISSYGEIKLKNKPELDIYAYVKNSKAQNIAAILPPNLVKETMVMEKIKDYGIFGDIEGKVNIKGRIPQPDVIGYAKGRNIKILDKNIHKLHNGNVDIIFNKRKLNMNILLEMANAQNAEIKGTTHMYRDGINDVTVKTTNNIDFPLAHKLVMPISKVFNFQLGPLGDMNIKSGSGNININIKGSLDFIDLNGYCSFDNANLTYNGLYGKITNAKGRLDFNQDNIIIKSETAYIQNNPFSVNGLVKINDNLNFNVVSNNVKAQDLLTIVNNSEILKDVKKGLVLFNKADGKTKFFVNISANIVPVPFGQPPLSPDEAFKDIKVNGNLNLLDDTCYLEGFKTPLKNINGIVNFTETVVDFKNLHAQSSNSSISLDGKIVTDIKTKVPDVALTITGNSIKIGDTIRFLAESYLYPKNYPDISPLYNFNSTHDLYLKYKAKSTDFLPDKIYAVMNIKKGSNILSLENMQKPIPFSFDDFKLEVKDDNVEIGRAVV